MIAGAELAPRDSHALAAADGLGAAAHRAAEIMLRTRPSTRASYQSVYRRFNAWLAERTGLENPSLEYFTADLVAGYLTHLEELGRAEATIRKDHAALNRLARYPHAIRAVDATEILMIAGTPINDRARTRDALDETTWRQVKTIARARLIGDAHTRASKVTAARDYAMVLLLGQAGLRSDELRRLPRDPYTRKRSDSDRAWKRQRLAPIADCGGRLESRGRPEYRDADCGHGFRALVSAPGDVVAVRLGNGRIRDAPVDQTEPNGRLPDAATDRRSRAQTTRPVGARVPRVGRRGRELPAGRGGRGHRPAA